MTSILSNVQELLKQYEPSAEDIVSIKKLINSYSQALKRNKTKPGTKQSRKKTYDTKKCWSKLENGSQCKRKQVSGTHFCRKHIHNSTEYGWITDTDASNNNNVIIGSITSLESESRNAIIQTRSKTKALTDAKKNMEVKNDEKLSVQPDTNTDPNVNMNYTKSSTEVVTTLNTKENTKEITKNDNNTDKKKEEGVKTRAQCQQATKKTAYYIREMNGIHYFVDEKNNVYKTESILDENAVAEIIGTLEDFESPQKSRANVEVKVDAGADIEVKEEANVIEEDTKKEKKNVKNTKTNKNKKQKRTKTNTKTKK